MSSIATEILDMKSTILLKYNDYFNSKYLNDTKSCSKQLEYLTAMDIYIMICEYYEEAQGESTVDINLWDVNDSIEKFVRCNNLIKKGYYD